MRWVCRRRPDVDLVASLWLIDRHIDDAAEFVFTDAPETGTPVNEFASATEMTVFESLVVRFGLTTDTALLRMARIVRAASVDDDIDIDLAGLGLALVGVGSLAVEPDDLLLVERLAFVFDSILAWCRSDAR